MDPNHYTITEVICWCHFIYLKPIIFMVLLLSIKDSSIIKFYTCLSLPIKGKPILF